MLNLHYRSEFQAGTGAPGFISLSRSYLQSSGAWQSSKWLLWGRPLARRELWDLDNYSPVVMLRFLVGEKKSVMRPSDHLPHARMFCCCRCCQYQQFCGVQLPWWTKWNAWIQFQAGLSSWQEECCFQGGVKNKTASIGPVHRCQYWILFLFYSSRSGNSLGDPDLP